MAFNIDTRPTFTRAVTAYVPDGATFREETFNATFRVVEWDKHDLKSSQGTTDFLKDVIVRLDDLAGAGDTPIEYSDEVRDRVLQLPYARLALAEAYNAGVSKGREGN